jgi:hypothetical protein
MSKAIGYAERWTHSACVWQNVDHIKEQLPLSKDLMKLAQLQVEVDRLREKLTMTLAVLDDLQKELDARAGLKRLVPAFLVMVHGMDTLSVRYVAKTRQEAERWLGSGGPNWEIVETRALPKGKGIKYAWPGMWPKDGVWGEQPREG